MSLYLKYVKAPAGWSHTDANPFTPDGAYGPDWSAFCLMDCEDNLFFTGQSGAGPFSARFGRGVQHLEQRLADFLRYENRYGRTVIVSLPPELNVDRFVDQAMSCTPEQCIIRPDDPPVLVHSTTVEAWKSIQADGGLKAASQLYGEQNPSRTPGKVGQVAAYMLNEPAEYADFIMFGDVHSCASEMVVASYRAGTFVMDENAVYEPGVRLYFDNHLIIRDGLGIRDGLHRIKVHCYLPLRPYLLAAVGLDEINPHGSVRVWTIRAFVDAANSYFRS